MKKKNLSLEEIIYTCDTDTKKIFFYNVEICVSPSSR